MRGALLAVAVAISAPVAWGIADAHRAPHGRPSLRIHGSVAAPLHPGAARPLEVTLANRRRVGLVVTRVLIRARVDARHRRAGCTRRDFAIRPVPRSAFPVHVRARGSVRLRARVRMKDLPRNQDACQGARLRLRLRYRAETR